MSLLAQQCESYMLSHNLPHILQVSTSRIIRF